MTQEIVAQNIKNELKSSIDNKMIVELKRKPVHGQFNQDLERPSGGKGKSLAWLCRSALKGERENLIIAARDQALGMCYHQRNIMKQPIDSKCRICYKAEEHSKYIVVGCATPAPSEYTSGHNKVAGYTLWMICKHVGL